MKMLLSVFLLVLTLGSLQINDPDKIAGTWLAENGQAKFEMMKKEDTYEATITWLKNRFDDEGEEKKDKNNNDASLRNRPIIGITIIKGLRFKNGKYLNGEIYSPEKGITANCVARLTENTLELTITKSFFTSHQTWKRL